MLLLTKIPNAKSSHSNEEQMKKPHEVAFEMIFENSSVQNK